MPERWGLKPAGPRVILWPMTTLMTLMGCIASQPPSASAPVQAEPLELGAVLQTVPTATEPVILPDPHGRVVVLELLRSPDW